MNIRKKILFQTIGKNSFKLLPKWTMRKSTNTCINELDVPMETDEVNQ